MSSATYVNPFAGASSLTAERIDQGQDFALTPGAPIRAIGDAKVLGIQPNWYEGQPFVYYQLTSGPAAGRVVFVAEQINPLVKPGQQVKAGQLIGTYASTGTGLELGWATPSGSTLARATTGYTEGQPTAAGESFSKFLASLGVRVSGSGSAAIKGAGGSNLGGSLFPNSIPFLGPTLQAGKAGLDLTGKAIETPIGAAAAAGGQAVGEGIVSWLAPEAKKLTLYAVFILGAVAMVVYGFSELLKPIGGPDLKRAAGRGAKAAAGAAIAA